MKKITLILSALVTGAFGMAHAGEDLSVRVEKMVSVSLKTGEGQDHWRPTSRSTSVILTILGSVGRMRIRTGY